MIKFKLIFIVIFLFQINTFAAGDAEKPMKIDWSFKGLTGKFDRASLQKRFSSL